MNLDELLGKFSRNSAVTPSALESFERNHSMQLPPEYEMFLKHANGGEGIIGKARYVILWRLEDLLVFNEMYDVEENAPDLFLFGSNGGGEAYAFDLRRTPTAIVSVPFIGMKRESAHPIASNFDAFLEGKF